MRLILLRHGETAWNRKRRIQGLRDIPLNEAGVQQMRTVSEHFSSGHFRFARILTSPLLRAKQSAQICSERLRVPLELVPALQERGFGELEGMTIEEIMDRYGLDCEDIVESVCGVESQKEVQARVNDCLLDLSVKYAGQDILLVTHGSIIKLIGKQYGMDVGIIHNGAYLELPLAACANESIRCVGKLTIV